MSDRIEASIEVCDWCKSQYPLPALPSVHDRGAKVCIVHTDKLNFIAHPQLAARLHQDAPRPCVDLLREQHFNATRSGLLLVWTPASHPKEPSRNNARIVQHQQVARSKMLRELSEDIVLPYARRPVEQKHPRAAALFGRLLSNQLFGQEKVEIRDEHYLILVRCWRAAAEMAFG